MSTPSRRGAMYCELICAAQGLAMHDQAAEWTEVMDGWRRGAPSAGSTVVAGCTEPDAGMSGPIDEAESEALAACDELRPWMRREFGWPLAELGNVRLRRGDLKVPRRRSMPPMSTVGARIPGSPG
ncbi:MAG: hypothetical protein R2716_10355 [Microthrixaceae bacterium]